MSKAAAYPVCDPDLDDSLDVGSSEKDRFERRRTTRQTARMVMNDASNGIRCTICDLSSAGAMLDLAESGGTVPAECLPASFRLYMPYDRVEVDCRIAWREEMKLGVQFTSPLRPLAKATRTRMKPEKKQPKSFLGRMLFK